MSNKKINPKKVIKMNKTKIKMIIKQQTMITLIILQDKLLRHKINKVLKSLTCKQKMGITIGMID